MGKLFDEYEDYRLFQEIMESEDPEPQSAEGCLSTFIWIVLIVAIILIIS